MHFFGVSAFQFDGVFCPHGDFGHLGFQAGGEVTYALEGDRNELAAHKGHRVEITGTLAPPVSSGGNAPASREFQTGVQRLRVQALKMTAESCK